MATAPSPTASTAWYVCLAAPLAGAVGLLSVPPGAVVAGGAVLPVPEPLLPSPAGAGIEGLLIVNMLVYDSSGAVRTTIEYVPEETDRGTVRSVRVLDAEQSSVPSVAT